MAAVNIEEHHAEQIEFEQFLPPSQPTPSDSHLVQDGSETQSKPPDEPFIPKPWISFWLRWYMLLLMIALASAMVGIITWLTIRSKRKQGIVSLKSVGTDTTFIPGVGVVGGKVAFSWTAVPTLIILLYTSCFGKTTAAALTRQPYIELRRKGDAGAAPEISILLDYNSMLSLDVIRKACWFGHWVVAIMTFVSLVLQFVATPIVASLFHVVTVPVSSAVSITQSVRFDGAAFGPQSDVVPILDTATATLNYNGTVIPWTTANSSLLPLDLDKVTSNQPANLSSVTETISMHLDCRPVEKEHYALRFVDGGVYFSAEDRGCSINGQPFSATPGQFTTQFVETYYLKCSLDAQLSRIMLVAALDEDDSTTSFSNVSVISCIPSYSTGYASITLGIGGFGSSPVLQSITPINSTLQDDPIPVFARPFEHYISLAQNYNDQTDETDNSALGNIILQYANIHWPGGPSSFFSTEALTNSTITIITGAFNIMAQTVLVQPISNSSRTKTIPSTLHLPQSRLAILPEAAWTLVGCLSATILALAATWIYESKHIYVQYEDCKAMVGMAALLCDSRIIAEASRTKRYRADGRVGSKLEVILKEEKDEGWKIPVWNVPANATIVSATMGRRRVGWGRH